MRRQRNALLCLVAMPSIRYPPLLYVPLCDSRYTRVMSLVLWGSRPRSPFGVTKLIFSRSRSDQNHPLMWIMGSSPPLTPDALAQGGAPHPFLTRVYGSWGSYLRGRNKLPSRPNCTVVSFCSLQIRLSHPFRGMASWTIRVPQRLARGFFNLFVMQNLELIPNPNTPAACDCVFG